MLDIINNSYQIGLKCYQDRVNLDKKGEKGIKRRRLLLSYLSIKGGVTYVKQVNKTY